MIKINENGKIEGRELHRLIESKTKQYNVWINRAIIDADLKESKDFCTKLYESTGGRPKKEYEFNIDAAKEICLLERNEKGKELRRWLIELSNKKENLELITVKEAAFAFKVVNCLKYIDNQKEAYSMHQNKFITENTAMFDSKNIYAEFAKYRTKITGWDKQKVDEAITTYLDNHSGYNRSKIDKSNMQTKLSIMDIGEAIRIACLDILFSKNTDENLAQNFSNLCKKLAKEMAIKPEKTNENNLFRQKEQLENVNKLSLNQ